MRCQEFVAYSVNILAISLERVFDRIVDESLNNATRDSCAAGAVPAGEPSFFS